MIGIVYHQVGHQDFRGDYVGHGPNKVEKNCSTHITDEIRAENGDNNVN